MPLSGFQSTIMSAHPIPLKPGINLGRVSGINSLPTFPAVACRLLSLIGDDEANFREVSQWLRTDTALSGQVLRVANSVLFGLRQEVKSVERAMCLVGTNRVRGLVATVALKNYMSRCDNVVLRSCWRHNLATAIWCETLAKCHNVDRPTGYTAGLLHDLGRMAMLMLLPTDYALFLEQEFSTDQDLLNLEGEQFDFNHCQIGHYLSRSWNFQPILADVIGHHHDEITPATPGCRALVQAACAAASMSGFHVVGRVRKWEPARIAGMLPRAFKQAQPPLDDLLQKVTDELSLVESSLL
jgi:HD-like signal output (HDOD) protein